MTSGPDKELLNRVRKFRVSAEPVSAIPFGNGHINDSFRIQVAEKEHPGYLLQKINDRIFSDVQALMENIERVTFHLKKVNPEKEDQILTLIRSEQGSLFVKDQSGYWRLFRFMDGVYSYDNTESPEQAYKAAKAFGTFVGDLKTLAPEELHITIPDFHNITVRMNQLSEAINIAGTERKEQVKKELKIIRKLSWEMEELYKTAISGEMPQRIIHNDTKLNNILFDAEMNAVSVIDLDTVMPGFIFFDLGDGIRSGVSEAAEDEKDLNRIIIDPHKYESYLTGYLDATHGFLKPNELKSFPMAGPYMAFIMAVRFLTDYLSGDVYYKTAYPDHNLIRSRAQLTLTEKLILQKRSAKDILQRFLN